VEKYTLVIYDISDDRLRQRVSDTCRAAGLTRIQKSAFLGRQTGIQRRSLLARLRALVEGRGGPRDNVQVFVLDGSQVRSRAVIGRPVVLEEGGVVYV